MNRVPVNLAPAAASVACISRHTWDHVTQGFYGRIKGGNVIAARGPTWESDVITDLAWMPCRSAPLNVDMYGAATP